jgi:hypothetical protein
MKKPKLLLIALFLLTIKIQAQQKESKIAITSSVGLLIPQSKFAKSYSTSLAFNSGIEYSLKKGFFIQGVIDFNSVKYSQQVREGIDDFLFQKTNSSVFLLGLNLGNNIPLTHSKRFFLAPYLGLGYLNIGEPRLSINNQDKVITQSVRRMQSIYYKGGLRFLINTNTKALQTIYLDVSSWKSPIEIQSSKAQAWSVFGGTKIPF